MRQKGFSLLSVLLGLAVMTVVVVISFSLSKKEDESLPQRGQEAIEEAQDLADKFEELNRAAQEEQQPPPQRDQESPSPAPTPAPAPTPVPAPIPPPVPQPPPPQPQPPPPAQTESYTIEADDYSASPSSITVNAGSTVNLTFKVNADDVYYGGLDFRSSVVNTGTIAPGGSKTVSFTAQSSFTLIPYWPASNVRKNYEIQVNALP